MPSPSATARAGAILRRVLLKLYFIWTAAVLRALGAQRVRLEVGDTRLLCYEIGASNGSPWVLLHGLGATALAWSAAVRRLRKDVRLLVPELSALGGTMSPAGGLNVVEGVEAVKALIEWWAPGRSVTLAGISLGGWMSVRLALERPDLVERLVLIDAAGYRDQNWEHIRDLTDVADLNDVDRLYKALFHRTPFIIRVSRRGFLKAYTSRAVKHVLESTRPEQAYGPGDLAAIEKPTLLIWGKHDGLFDLDVARAMERHLPDARLVTVRDAGHAVHWERPRTMATAIDRFRRQGLEAFADDQCSAA